MGGEKPLRYVDVDDTELVGVPGSWPRRSAAAGVMPLVLVGDEVKSPSGISIYWVEDQLRSLGREVLRGRGHQGRDLNAMASYDLRCVLVRQGLRGVRACGFLKDEAKVCPDCGGREVSSGSPASAGSPV